MKNIKIKCPAKINLTLKVLNKREDGYHNIKSIMQMINLYDYLNISVGHADTNTIFLSGNSDEIPYNEKNLVYKAAELYLNEAGINNVEIKINIEKKKMNKEHMKQEIASIKLIILSERQIITLDKKARPIYMLSTRHPLQI